VIEPHAFGGPGGIRTPVQNTFLFASYSNKIGTEVPNYLGRFGIFDCGLKSLDLKILIRTKPC